MNTNIDSTVAVAEARAAPCMPQPKSMTNSRSSTMLPTDSTITHLVANAGRPLIFTYCASVICNRKNRLPTNEIGIYDFNSGNKRSSSVNNRQIASLHAIRTIANSTLMITILVTLIVNSRFTCLYFWLPKASAISKPAPV